MVCICYGLDTQTATIYSLEEWSEKYKGLAYWEWYQKGEAYYKDFDFKNASTCLEIVLTRFPDHKDVLLIAGKSFSANNSESQGLDCFSHFLALYPKDKYNLERICFFLESYEKYNELCEFTDLVLAVYPNDAFYLGFKSDALVGLGRYNEVIDVCNILIELYPDSIDNWMIKARALEKLGMYKEAEECYNHKFPLH